MTSTIIILLISVWAFYKAFKLKSSKLFLALVLVISLQFFCKWPLTLPPLFAFGFTALFSAGTCFYKFSKKKDQDLLTFGLFFLLFGIVFLIQALIPYFVMHK